MFFKGFIHWKIFFAYNLLSIKVIEAVVLILVMIFGLLLGVLPEGSRCDGRVFVVFVEELKMLRKVQPGVLRSGNQAVRVSQTDCCWTVRH